VYASRGGLRFEHAFRRQNTSNVKKGGNLAKYARFGQIEGLLWVGRHIAPD
jgi:hypothetical protein